MPWKVVPVSDIRLSFVHLVRSLGKPVAAACREFGISRKTAYKWLKRFDADSSQCLHNHPCRPHCSPAQTAADIEQQVLAVRDRFGWGPRKIRALLIHDNVPVPSIRTCSNILRRNGRVQPARPAEEPLQFFERSAPNQLWQCDFKGPLEVERRRIAPFTVLDDHSRFLLALRACTEQTTRSAWQILWDVFGEYGLPDEILCDNFFGCQTVVHLPSTSWFESRLLRLNIRCIHGRPYHPQTQGKIERLHGTLERELWPLVRRDCIQHFDTDCDLWRCRTYNPIRPHEALADRPPLTRYRPSARRRPDKLPDLVYDPAAVVRKVSSVGDIRWRNCRILIGRGLVGDTVRVEETDHEVLVYYAQTIVRRLAFKVLKPDTFI